MNSKSSKKIDEEERFISNNNQFPFALKLLTQNLLFEQFVECLTKE